MSAIQGFLNCLHEYQKTQFMLVKCSVFVKKHSKSKMDLSAFCNDNERVVTNELNTLVDEAKNKQWEITISSFNLKKNIICLKLARPSLIKSVFLEVSDLKSSYGIQKSFLNKTFQISSNCNGDNMTQLRMSVASRVLTNLITAGGGSVTADGTEHIHLSHNPGHDQSAVIIGPVKVSTGLNVSGEDFKRLRSSDMEAMGDHKDLSEEMVAQLVDAAIIFDFLSIRLEKPICLDLSPEPKSTRKTNCKGAPFVLYNYVRLCAILERFDNCVMKGLYQPLPPLCDINYSLLSQEDEWSIVYDFIAEWPTVVAECQEVTQPRLHRLPVFLSELASTFSVYYRHSHVLNEGLPHMQPLMQARIWLLKVVRQIYLNAFSLLGIVAPTAM